MGLGIMKFSWKHFGLLILILSAFLFPSLSETQPATKEVYKSLPETEPQGVVARIIFFSEPTCEECAELKSKILPKLFEKYPGQISCRIYEIDQVDNFLLLDRFEKKYGLAKNEVPILFMDGKVRSGLEEEVKKLLEEDIKASLAKGGNPWAEPAPPEEKIKKEDAIKKRLESVALLALIGAGLSDGLNPCAFTTIVFLISYLSIIGRKRKEVLKTGIIYTMAVFITYLALGFGLMTIVSRIVNIALASRILYGATAVVAFAVSYLSLRDYLKARKGQFKDMTLKLSDGMQKRIHKSIHDKVKNLGIITAALVLGVMVALFELPCTGQMYLPVITALSNPNLRSRAIPYLLLYNLMFIIPLIIVFIVAYFGVSSESIGDRFRRHIGAIKIAMGGIFLALGCVLVYMALH